MCNFHIDFNMEDAGKDEEIYSTESYFLGKKIYYDKVESKHKDGNIINEDHIRMKGIPTNCVKYFSKNTNIDVIDLFDNLYNGNSITFDLTNNNAKPIFKFNKDKSASSLKYGDSETTKTISLK